MLLGAAPPSGAAWAVLLRAQLAALALVPLGALGTGLAFVLMTTLVGRVGGPRGAVATYFIPVVAIALGVSFLDERVAPLALTGTALVLGGAWLTSRREA
jgi:drug/metabolite transporter (DMT)-like permease